MKYIRTKDGIYEVEEWFKPLENDMVYIPNEGLNKILNQADTIEELCDEFVIKVDNQKESQVPSQAGDTFCSMKSLYNEYLKTNKYLLDEGCDKKELCDYKLYGAIWTDKGLIYVAKMNEKGELELL